MLNLCVKTLYLLFFLTSFLTGCFEDSTPNLDTPDEQAPGKLVAETEYCQRVERVDPVQVRKHELPVALQGYRDHCRSLIQNRPEDFSETTPSFTCFFTWSQNSEAENLAIENFLDGREGAGFTAAMRTEGDLDLVLNPPTQRLIFTITSETETQLMWTKAQLWPELSTPVPDLESLSWRLGFQHQNSVVCSAQAKWDVQDSAMYLRNVEKCYAGDGTATKDTYTFSPSGELVSLEQSAGQLDCR